MIVTQITTLHGTCPTCGHEDVRLCDVIDMHTGRTLHVVCENCMDEEPR